MTEVQLLEVLVGLAAWLCLMHGYSVGRAMV